MHWLASLRPPGLLKMSVCYNNLWKDLPSSHLFFFFFNIRFVPLKMINTLNRGKKSCLPGQILKGFCYLLYKYTFQLLQHPLQSDLFYRRTRNQHFKSSTSRTLLLIHKCLLKASATDKKYWRWPRGPCVRIHFLFSNSTQTPLRKKVNLSGQSY